VNDALRLVQAKVAMPPFTHAFSAAVPSHAMPSSQRTDPLPTLSAVHAPSVPEQRPSPQARPREAHSMPFVSYGPVQ
jgi:hypothetical protein